MNSQYSRHVLPLLGALTALALAGCASPARTSETQLDFLNMKSQMERHSVSALRGQVHERPAITRIVKPNALPVELEEQVTLNRNDIASLDDLSRRLSRISGLPVRITREAEEFVASRKSARAETIRPAVINPNAAAPVSFQDEPAFLVLSYTGSKKGLFDVVASRLGLYWRYEKGSVHLFLTDTRTFFLPALPSQSSMKDSSKGQSSGSGSATSAGSSNGAGAQSELEVSSTVSIWIELEKTIRSMLTNAGRVVVNPANGSVVVTDTPESLDRIAKLIDDQKKFLGKQVALEVQVFNLTLSDERSFGVDVNLASQYLARYGITLQSSASASTQANGSSALAFSVLDTATGTAAKFAGSSVLINALQGQGTISNMRTATLVSLNNHAVPMRVGRNIAYLAQSSLSTTANVGVTQSLQLGNVSEGYTLSLLPTILEDDQLMLQMTLNISQLRQLRSLVSGGSRVEGPETDEASTIQRAVLKNGETLMLAGFEADQKVADDRTGFLSFGTRGNRARTLLVVLVTPVVTAGR